jgi:ketosteroid isomerase-like protein
MKKNSIAMILLAAVMFSGSMAVGQETISHKKTDKLKEQVQEFNNKFAEANVSGNVEAVASFYADDITYMPNYAPMVRGKEAIMEQDKKMAESGVKMISMTLTTLEVTDMGDMVYEIGNYAIEMAMPGVPQPVSDKGKYVSIYRKLKDGSLEMVVDIWNTDVNPFMEMEDKK